MQHPGHAGAPAFVTGIYSTSIAFNNAPGNVAAGISLPGVGQAPPNAELFIARWADDFSFWERQSMLWPI